MALESISPVQPPGHLQLTKTAESLQSSPNAARGSTPSPFRDVAQLG